MLDALALPTPLTALVQLRRAEPGDLAQLLELLSDDPLSASREAPYPHDAGYARALAQIIEDLGNELIVGVQGAQIIAMLQLTRIPGISRGGCTRLNVEAVRVRAEHRSSGLGTALLRWVIDQAAPACDADLIQLTSDSSRAGAHRFYERLGFTCSHLGFKLRR
ncbi:GNAT family N-acetyltransferase [Glutamicibacter sp.]|uniref:GNAT family N-acetyltransferase n=1 Tax=Glutamicibacter sp. TaxID=1931995 RepID=UPI002B4A7D12|nr:GNAT family N-acetyltransferase [Glutamicibacter sp.]HJX80255.1 GNAT family N-acetyltransferase [Glutamicibacter sp.]